MSQQEQGIYAFGDFRLDGTERVLYHHGNLVALTPKALDTLLALVRHAGHVISKEELMLEVWPETFVEEGNLNVNVFALRKALAEPNSNQVYIETVPRRGYRFVAPVRLEPPASETLIVEAVRRSRVVTEEITEGHNDPALGPAQAMLTEEPALHLQARQSRASPLLSAKKLALGVSLAAVVVLGGYLARGFLRTRMNPQNRRIMLGVLPLVDLSGNSEQEYLSDGLTEEIISQLGSLNPSRLGVIARTSVMNYKHTNKGVKQIAGELGVDYVVEGSVRRSGNRVRVTAQLIQASDQSHLWAESYDRDLGDILNVEEDVSRSIAKAIRIQLKPPEPQSARTRPVSTQAYENYLRGRYLVGQRHRWAIENAIQSYGQAVAEDPNYAQAYASLADAYLLLGLFSVRTIDVMPKAESAAAKALELDSSLAEAHASMGGVKSLCGNSG